MVINVGKKCYVRTVRTSIFWYRICFLFLLSYHVCPSFCLPDSFVAPIQEFVNDPNAKKGITKSIADMCQARTVTSLLFCR